MTLDRSSQPEPRHPHPQNAPIDELQASIPVILSFLDDPLPAIRERSLSRLVELKESLKSVPPPLAQFLLEERDARLVARGVDALSSCVSRDSLATSLLTHLLSDSRQLVSQRARAVIEEMSELPLEIRYPYQSSLALKYAGEASRARAKELYQKIHPYIVVEGATLGARPFLDLVEALCLPVSDLQALSLDVLCRVSPSLNERQRGVVEAACTYSFKQAIASQPRVYEGLLELLREVSSGPSIARIVYGVDTGEDLNLRLHRDFTASYISRNSPLPQAFEELLDGLWHHLPLVVSAVASNVGVLLEEFPRHIGERVLDNFFEVLRTRAGEGREFVHSLLKLVQRQSLYEESIVRRVSETVARTKSSNQLLAMIDVLRVNPPERPHTQEKVGSILRYLAGSENASVADAANQLLESPDLPSTMA